jgi:glycosyltransferase involved in cell wall biosynthesis
VTIRILHIIPTLVRGGAEKQLALLAAGLPRDTFDVHVAVLTHSGPLEEDLRAADVPLHFIGKQWKVDPFAWRRLRNLIRTLRPDIVHTWLFAANSYGRSAAWSAGVKQIVGGERCVDPWKQWHQFAIDRWLLDKSRCVVTNSTGVQAFYGEHGFPEEKFVVIPNGVALPTAPPLDRGAFLAEWNIPEDARLTAAVGRLWPQKRIKDLIWAGDLLRCVRDDTHLLIIGDGPQRWRLERYRDQCDMIGRIHFLGERSDVSSLLPLCDCLWLASGYEGQSNAILEAMAAGLPVVATDIPGNRDLVVPDVTGYLVAAGDRAGFARKTNVLLNDERLRQRLGQAGRERIAREFTVEQMVARHADLYQRLVQEG